MNKDNTKLCQMVLVKDLLATKFIEGTFVGWPGNRIFWWSET